MSTMATRLAIAARGHPAFGAHSWILNATLPPPVAAALELEVAELFTFKHSAQEGEIEVRYVGDRPQRPRRRQGHEQVARPPLQDVRRTSGEL